MLKSKTDGTTEQAPDLFVLRVLANYVVLEMQLWIPEL